MSATIRKRCSWENMRTPLWFVDFDWTRFDPEKDKLCLLEEQDRKRLFKKKKKTLHLLQWSLAKGWVLLYWTREVKQKQGLMKAVLWREDGGHLPQGGWGSTETPRTWETPYESFNHAVTPRGTAFLKARVTCNIYSVRGFLCLRERYELSLFLIFCAFQKVLSRKHKGSLYKRGTM